MSKTGTNLRRCSGLGHLEGRCGLYSSIGRGHLDLLFPLAAPLGTTTLILLAVSLVIVPAAPFVLKATELAPRRSEPLMVTTVPGGPLVGVNVVMVGADFHWAVKVTGLPPVEEEVQRITRRVGCGSVAARPTNASPGSVDVVGRPPT